MTNDEERQRATAASSTIMACTAKLIRLHGLLMVMKKTDPVGYSKLLKLINLSDYERVLTSLEKKNKSISELELIAKKMSEVFKKWDEKLKLHKAEPSRNKRPN